MCEPCGEAAGALAGTGRGAQGVTLRAVLAGVVGITLLSLVNPYTCWVMYTWSVGSGQLLNSAVFVLFLLVAANTALARVWPSRAFSRAELLVVYAMLCVALGLLQQGGLPYLVAIITYPFYAATPENQWQHLIWPHIPLHFRVAGAEAVDWLWEGMPEGARLPWGQWAVPWLEWGVFTFALMAAMYCLSALLSRDWIHRQRLTFPLVEVPLAMVGDAPSPTLGRGMLRSRVFWLGFAIPAAISTSAWLHRFWPNFPAPELYGIHVGRAFSGMGLPWSVLEETRVSVLFAVIGVMCLLPSEVVLSLWFFWLVYKIELLAWASFGVAPGGSRAVVNPQLFASYQEAGAYLALSGILLYESRHALGRAWRSLLGRGCAEVTPSSPLSGRAALAGLLGSAAFMLWFGVRAGMPGWLFALLFTVFFSVLLGSTRLVAAAGVLYPDTGRYAYSLLPNMLGGQVFTPGALTAYTYFVFIYMQDPMNVAMPQMMNNFKLADAAPIRGRPLTVALAVAMVTVLVAGVTGLLVMLYHKGAGQLRVWPFFSWANWAFSDLSASLRNPEAPDNWLRLAVGLGAVIATALVLLHMHVPWWPLSPIGFLIASTYTSEWILWNNALVAWLLTTQLKRYGGLRLYRACRPAFIGLILGDYLSDGCYAILNTLLDLRKITG